MDYNRKQNEGKISGLRTTQLKKIRLHIDSDDEGNQNGPIKQIGVKRTNKKHRKINQKVLKKNCEKVKKTDWTQKKKLNELGVVTNAVNSKCSKENIILVNKKDKLKNTQHRSNGKEMEKKYYLRKRVKFHDINSFKENTKSLTNKMKENSDVKTPKDRKTTSKERQRKLRERRKCNGSFDWEKHKKEECERMKKLRKLQREKRETNEKLLNEYRMKEKLRQRKKREKNKVQIYKNKYSNKSKESKFPQNLNMQMDRTIENLKIQVRELTNENKRLKTKLKLRILESQTI